MDSKESLFRYCLRFADSHLILSHRLSEWCGAGPFLEEDLALTNISLDILGQANGFYEYAAGVENSGRTADDLAFLRNEREYRNLLLVEQPNGDYAQTMLRQYFWDVYAKYLYKELSNSSDATIAGIAKKAAKENQYHLRHSSLWIERFGNGTAESMQRLKQGMENLWHFTGDFFEGDELDAYAAKAGLGPNPRDLQKPWTQEVQAHLGNCGIEVPAETVMITGSRKGTHTEHLGYILSVMQILPRMYPNAKW